MRERPILFNGEMVRAVLEDRKTQTLRVMKPQIGEPPSEGAYFDAYDCGPQWNWWSKENFLHNEALIIKCPYGQVGDRLWVRETWRPTGYDLKGQVIKYRADDSTRVCDSPELLGGTGLSHGETWTPSIFMPRWASRSLNDVTGIRVERVQDITVKDCVSEGWPDIDKYSRFTIEDKPLIWFKALWDSINAKPKPVYKRNDEGEKEISHYVSYPWEEGTEIREHKGKPWYVYGNPWVWVIEFKKVD